MRVARPGSVIGPQQQYLEAHQAQMWREGELFRARAKQVPGERAVREQRAAARAGGAARPQSSTTLGAGAVRVDRAAVQTPNDSRRRPRNLLPIGGGGGGTSGGGGVEQSRTEDNRAYGFAASRAKANQRQQTGAVAKGRRPNTSGGRLPRSRAAAQQQAEMQVQGYGGGGGTGGGGRQGTASRVSRRV